MGKFTVSLFIVACCFLGYRYLQEVQWTTNVAGPALAQSALLADEGDATAQADTLLGANPTVAPLFRNPVEGAVTPTVIPGQTPTRILQPTASPATQPTAVPNILRPAYPEMVIYDDELDRNWSIEQSVETQVNLWDNRYWFQRFEPTQDRTSGATAITVAPQADYGTLFFTVRPESDTVYERQKVLGVSFWLNSGNDGIATDELAVSVVGSNELPYWSATDRSVFPENVGAFSETRLYFLKVNRTIPAHTWINVVVWLDDLEYDPVYRYVTGFYIKNDVGFRSTYAVDQVVLLMMP